MGLFKNVLFAAFAACLLGCAGHVDAVKPESAGLYIEGVPFFPQDEYMCGPAALASVIGYYGSSSGMKDVAVEVYSEKLKGTLPMDLLLYAKAKGFEAKYYKGSMNGLKESLTRGEPLILFLNLGYSFYPVGHYIVAVGMDQVAGVVFAHSGTEKEQAFTMKELEKSWAKTGYSTLLVRPKERPE
ncbi:MAG: C39 family peptidase [Deltaproteobacteria bacterium]|nr:C39 family peptidase [Deltaproteobacteria bacterium]